MGRTGSSSRTVQRWLAAPVAGVLLGGGLAGLVQLGLPLPHPAASAAASQGVPTAQLPTDVVVPDPRWADLTRPKVAAAAATSSIAARSPLVRSVLGGPVWSPHRSPVQSVRTSSSTRVRRCGAASADTIARRTRHPARVSPAGDDTTRPDPPVEDPPPPVVHRPPPPITDPPPTPTPDPTPNPYPAPAPTPAPAAAPDPAGMAVPGDSAAPPSDGSGNPAV